MNSDSPLSIGQLATLASTLEVTIPKPGNVHRSADFSDTTLSDFLRSAIAIGPAMQAAKATSLGETVLTAVKATRSTVNTNTNLGIVLLLAPLAAVEEVSITAVAVYLQESTADDACRIYEAIAAAAPGGLGKSEQLDVNSADAPNHILQAMKVVADGDMIARQYINGLRDVFEFVWPAIEEQLSAGHSLTDSVIHAHLATMVKFPDSLITRKNGEAVANESAARAAAAIESGPVGSQDWLREISNLDFWLRADGNRRNPGTTADLIAAAIFVGLRQNQIDIRNIK